MEAFSQRKWYAPLADGLLLAVAMATSSLITLGDLFPWHSTMPTRSVAPMVLAMCVGAVISGILSIRLENLTLDRPSVTSAFFVFFGTFAVLAVSIATMRPYWSRSFVVVAGAVWLSMMLLFRLTMLRKKTRSYLVISDSSKFVEELKSTSEAPFVLVLHPLDEAIPVPLPDYRGILVDFGHQLSFEMAQLISANLLSGVPVHAFSDFYEANTGKLPITHLGDGWGLPNLRHNNPLYQPVKRFLDITAVLALALPALLVTAAASLAIRVDSRGPAIFKQTRCGKDGVPFTLYKLRTMIDTSEVDGPSFATPNDLRTTRVGQTLRRLHIDELPQLWNILRGDLSLIGPRPEQLAFVKKFKDTIPFYVERHSIRPGLTGWAQVTYHYAASIDETIEKLAYDLYYIKHMGPSLDLTIAFRTVFQVLRQVRPSSVD
jgi:lipopolysaccharide/colanic/teichoic acid biosynthesis glycosyltransferase